MAQRVHKVLGSAGAVTPILENLGQEDYHKFQASQAAQCVPGQPGVQSAIPTEKKKKTRQHWVPQHQNNKNLDSFHGTELCGKAAKWK